MRGVASSIGSLLGLAPSDHTCSSNLAELRRERDEYRSERDFYKMRLHEVSAECGRYRTWFDQAKQRELVLQEQNASLSAENKRLKRDLYGRKSDAKAQLDDPKADGSKTDDAKKPPKRARGQQPGNPTPPRRDHSNLAVIEETSDLHDQQRFCPGCGESVEPVVGMDDVASVIEINVKAYVRKIRKPCYRPTCTCGLLPGIVSQPVIGAVLPGSNLGVSTISEYLLGKFFYGQPTYRLLEQWRDLGLDLPSSTMYGLQKPLKRLFQPLADLIAERNRTANYWGLDETRWLAMIGPPERISTRCWLWVVITADTVYFIMARTRGAIVVTQHLGKKPRGIATVDRHTAYKAVAARSPLFLLQFCWAHVRRDFITLVVTILACQADALLWLEQIGLLYAANDVRVALLEHPKAIAFRRAVQELRRLVEQFKQKIVAWRARRDNHPALQAAITSMHNHMHGLWIFVDHPEIPMDNNLSENAIRPEVILRKNSLFSGSWANAQFLATMSTILRTVQKNGINPRTWLIDYLRHCAAAGGRPPPDLERFLPWKATGKDLLRWSAPDTTKPWPGQGRPDHGGG